MESNFFKNAELKLLRKDGSAVLASEALKEADFVLLYFSAHWCPPCREFTPLLKKFYEAQHEKKRFEVVFMSLDNSEKEMLDYFAEAHGDYYCMTYADTKAMSWGWGQKYGFKTIPTLLVFENGSQRNLMAKCGRKMVLKDPSAETFPWRDADAMQPAQRNTAEYIRNGLLVLCILWLVYSFLTR
ncbi:tryparedoxin-like protein [Leptomonas pyrrhocoris]|uniref:Tryparedoxin-like protein n=1 Tax=Leptomonas pyrrhocoris TaxID=157538 RepID=A0A0M9FYN1_LEPPY|nr:tryparedoxin-like protein [Leptomonas pyrrhocoris]KPA78785.1 tryparedoxin-like protein [Leptomonas pyrrhocoris]|eukprot:XP_015657224.1 tryparedoxin-like protein [Leptomonas pyrrhocoris]